MSGERLTLKEMCAKFDVTARTLRYYEYIELLFPEKVGRSRYFGPTEFARMQLILRGKRWGFSLEEVRQWLEMYDKANQAKQLRAWIPKADRQLVELQSQYKKLGETILELRKMRDFTAEHLRNEKEKNKPVLPKHKNTPQK